MLRQRAETSFLLFLPGIENPHPYCILCPPQKTSNERLSLRQQTGKKPIASQPFSWGISQVRCSARIPNTPIYYIKITKYDPGLSIIFSFFGAFIGISGQDTEFPP